LIFFPDEQPHDHGSYGDDKEAAPGVGREDGDAGIASD